MPPRPAGASGVREPRRRTGRRGLCALAPRRRCSVPEAVALHPWSATEGQGRALRIQVRATIAVLRTPRSRCPVRARTGILSEHRAPSRRSDRSVLSCVRAHDRARGGRHGLLHSSIDIAGLRRRGAPTTTHFTAQRAAAQALSRARPIARRSSPRSVRARGAPAARCASPVWRRTMARHVPGREGTGGRSPRPTTRRRPGDVINNNKQPEWALICAAPSHTCGGAGVCRSTGDRKVWSRRHRRPGQIHSVATEVARRRYGLVL